MHTAFCKDIKTGGGAGVHPRQMTSWPTNDTYTVHACTVSISRAAPLKQKVGCACGARETIYSLA